jgi:glycosyltransferase involved in cell wall biosynthesis
VISGTVQSRLRKFGGIQSDVLYPPPPKRDYRHDRYGDYLFGVSRLAPLKRFDLILRALAEPIAAGIKFVVAGEGAELERLKGLASQLDVEHRVQFVGRLTDAEMIDHLARCRAVVFPPFNEDYGFVTVEAFMCGKPVITCTDSGGPAELVHDGENGYVTAPVPDALAGAMRKLMDDRNLATRMGEEGHRMASAMTWSDAVRQLLV